MLKYSITNPSSFEYNTVALFNTLSLYKIYLRTNIEKNNDKYSYNEYSLLKKYSTEDELKKDIENNFDLYLEIAKLEEENDKKNEEIKILKNKLSNTDYQVIKCFEKYMIGNTLPYEFSSLIATRTDIRDKINELDGTTNGEDSTLLNIEKNKKITEMCSASQFTITNGVDYNNKHFSLNTYDQINLTTLGSLAQQGQNVPYHADGELCTIFTAEEMLGLITVSTNWIVYHTTYFNLLKHQINDMTTIEEVKACYYGMPLTGEYKTILEGITSSNKS